MNDPVQKALEESRLKKESENRTEETIHCQKYLDSLHEVMNYQKDQPEY